MSIFTLLQLRKTSFLIYTHQQQQHLKKCTTATLPVKNIEQGNFTRPLRVLFMINMGKTYIQKCFKTSLPTRCTYFLLLKYYRSLLCVSSKRVFCLYSWERLKKLNSVQTKYQDIRNVQKCSHNRVKFFRAYKARF